MIFVAVRLVASAQDHLHGQVAAQVLVPDLEDRAHPPARDLALELVARAQERVLLQALHERIDGRAAGRSDPLPLVEGDLGVDALAVALLQPAGEGAGGERIRIGRRIRRGKHRRTLRRMGFAGDLRASGGGAALQGLSPTPG